MIQHRTCCIQSNTRDGSARTFKAGLASRLRLDGNGVASIAALDIRRGSHRGLTVLEVLFAIGIILIGLVGIAAMVPFAGRQASESYRIAHSLANGSNALAAFEGDFYLLPNSDRPWQMVDDVYNKGNPHIPHQGWVFANSPAWQLLPPFGATNRTFFPSLERLYDGNRARQASLYRYHLDSILSTGELGGNARGQVALAQNRALGQGFCIDPYFYSEQTAIPDPATVQQQKVMRGAWGNLRRTRFPFYDEAFPTTMNPLDTSTSAKFATPRLLRISFRDPSLPLTAPAGPAGLVWLDKAWARGDAARLTATIESRDLESDKSPDGNQTYRQFQAMIPDLASGPGYGDVIKAADSGSMQSWIATLTPADSTPIVNPLSLDTPTPTSLPGMEFFPETYDVSIVVFGKRDVREFSNSELRNGNYSGYENDGVVPRSERLTRVLEIAPDSASSGTFEIQLGAFDGFPRLGTDENPSNVSAKVVVGDWIMLSRYVYDDPLTVNFPIREKHRWYRVVGVTGLDVFPRRIRIAGAPWDWSVHELDAIARQNRANPSITVPLFIDPTVVPTVATVLSNVVTVYQRSLKINK